MSCKTYDPCLNGKLNQIGSYASVARQSAEASKASATQSANSATSAAESAAEAAASAEIAGVYLGAFAVAPVPPIEQGALYFNTVSNQLFVWNGTSWSAVQTDDIYLGGFAVAPTLNNQGLPLVAGNLYWNTASNNLWAWNGSAWVQADFDESTPFLATGTTTPRNLVTREADVVNVKDFGAVGNGVADDTAAIQAAIVATTTGKALFFPSGTYTFSTQLVFNTSKIGIIGEGSGTTFLKYTGANTTNDLIVVGDGITQIVNVNLSGFTLYSTTTMTGGFAIHLKKYCRSNVADIIVNGQDIAPVNVYSGIWFDGLDDVYLSTFRTFVQAEGVRVNGLIGVGQPKAGLMVEQGKITGGTIGVHIGGAFGGTYINNVDIIGATQEGILLDNSIAAETNRETFLGVCSIDSTGSYGIRVVESFTSNQTLNLTGTWVASSGNHGIFIQNAPGYKITASGCRIFNNNGDGIRTANNGSAFIVTGCSIANNTGYGVNGVINNSSMAIASNSFVSNALGDINNVTGVFPLSQYNKIQNELIIGGLGATATGRNLTIDSADNFEMVSIGNSNASLTQTLQVITANGIGNSINYDYLACGNTSGGSFRVRGDGTLFADNATIQTPADYAEMFEWQDGNPNNEDRVGQSVVLVGNKIRIAENGEIPIGVVSAEPTMVGDAAPFRWSGAFSRDEFGRKIKENVEIVEWKEIKDAVFHYEKDGNGKDILVIDKEKEEITHSYESTKIPSGITPPNNAEKNIIEKYLENPNWDKTKEYIPRIERKEWSAIGLLGKLRIRKGQATSPTWIKMSDISDTIEEWLIK